MCCLYFVNSLFIDLHSIFNIMALFCFCFAFCLCACFCVCVWAPCVVVFFLKCRFYYGFVLFCLYVCIYVCLFLEKVFRFWCSICLVLSVCLSGLLGCQFILFLKSISFRCSILILYRFDFDFEFDFDFCYFNVIYNCGMVIAVIH